MTDIEKKEEEEGPTAPTPTMFEKVWDHAKCSKWSQDGWLYWGDSDTIMGANYKATYCVSGAWSLFSFFTLFGMCSVSSIMSIFSVSCFLGIASVASSFSILSVVSAIG